MPRPVPLPLPLAATPLIPCTQCAKCCTYVGVGINTPRSVRYATDVLWYLYHDNVTVHRDSDGEWMVIFETRCKHLGEDKLCGVYEHRPLVCREFDNRGCEVNAPGQGITFSEPAQFLRWLKGNRPGLFKRIAKRYTEGGQPPRPAARG